jgi:hypothetical protein
MKRNMLPPRLLWLLILLPGPALAHQQADYLKVEGHVEQLEICSLDDDMISLEFDLRLRLEATGDEKIIVDRGTPSVTYWRTAPDLETLLASGYGHFSWFQYQGAQDVPTAPRKDHKILKPGRSIEFFLQASIPERPLFPGRYLLQIVAENWSGPAELEQNWRRYGKVWAAPFVSEPIEFTIPEGLRLAECSGL